MFGYYTTLAVRGLRSQLALTLLIIAAVGVGIGASVTTLTVYRGMAADPIPRKSAHLFRPQIDNFGPGGGMGPAGADGLQDRLTYTDALALLQAHAAFRQAAMYATGAVITSGDPRHGPFDTGVRATSSDFFAMFAVPFQYGTAWTRRDETDHSRLIVITRDLNDRLFGGADSVGKTLTLDGDPFRIVGVLDHWRPLPRFYDLDAAFAAAEDVFLPFTVAIEQKRGFGNVNCKKAGAGWDDMIRGECVWVHFWVELPTQAAVAEYQRFLSNYADEQRRSGRFQWQARTRLRNVREWLEYRQVVSTEARILVVVSCSFLFVCLLNAAGLMLAKLVGRARDISVRRALGASRRAIFAQCLLEASLVGLAGGLVGLLLTASGLNTLHALVSDDVRVLLRLDATDVGICVVLAVLATMVAGLYPTWRTARLPPASHLKTL